MHILPGSPHPLGATYDGAGVNFALYSEHAKAVELCLFDDRGVEARMALPHRTAYVWHGYVPDLRPGQRYGYRVDGDYDPSRGLRFNPEVVLLDPYAKALDGVERWEAGCFAYELGSPEHDLKRATAPQLGAPLAVVVDPEFDWEGDTPPRTPLHRSVIYEAHVRGLTMRHPAIPEPLRGRYAGVAHPAMIRHLHELGVTAIELMPIHAFVDDKSLLDRGLRNYWGYNSIGFFAPDVRYRTSTELGSEVREFKSMVKALHRAGIEVILDVVYNHTAEGSHLGPTFSFKGIDNPTYYRLASDCRYYFDYTGTGNTLNVRHPQVLALIMDSLRYWAEEMHVDGFRFDLASALARQLHDVDRLSSFFTLIHDSPALRDVKLIAEPWDVGEGGYQVGNFPVRWAEWNGRYRDSVRALWKGEGKGAGELAYRLTGSSDLYEGSGRRPTASINFITAHDGFTLADLVSYNHKRNLPNGECDNDGTNENWSWNCGAEGPSGDPEINTLRRRQRRNLLATLLLSQGTPMLVAGDEIGRTQQGNNNAYCQDNETSWIDWQLDDEKRALLEFTKRLVRLRRAHPALRRSKFFQGRPIHGAELSDLAWFRPDGREMSEHDWQSASTSSIAMFIGGRAIDDVDDMGRPLVDDNLLVVINAGHEDLTFTVPALPLVKDEWQSLIDTADVDRDERVPSGGTTVLKARSLRLLRSPSRVVRHGGAVHRLGATYRLQLTSKFRFADATALVDYLGSLGITDIYASPIFAAAPGSSHGYDVVDHQRLNEELGTEAEFEAFTDELRARGMGLLIDWVPNHMGIEHGANALWNDVLENGPSSLYAETFDIDWSPPKPDLQDTILLPVLGDQYGDVLERGDLEVVYEDGFSLRYFEHRFPLGPKSLRPIIASVVRRLELPDTDEDAQELGSILDALENLPDRRDTQPARRRGRAREKEVVRRRIRRLLAASPPVAHALGLALGELNGTPGDPRSFDALDAVIREQSYRLASWRVAAEEINYRRFFDVNVLAAIRMEDPHVFDRAHRLLFRLLEERRVQALRLDHTDGLYDPLTYFEALQRRFIQATARDGSRSPDDLVRPVPILVEKILERGERLPQEWPVDGTTGYEFAASVFGLWVDREAEQDLTRQFARFTGDGRSFSEQVYAAKLLILQESVASEVNMLARQLERIASRDRRSRDFTLISLTRALTETLAAFPVYRTYLRDSGSASDADVRIVSLSVRLARRRSPGVDASLFKFLQRILLLDTDGSEEEKKTHRAVALRFQQLSGPVMAKALEDTAFYRYHRLLSLNEVGGDPGRFGTDVEEFHAQNLERFRSWPLSMLTTSTHDTKRGEDANARIAVISEMPAEWQRAVTRWARLAQRYKVGLEDIGPAPVRRDEYLFYQSLLGSWPVGWDGQGDRQELVARMSAFMEKGTKEAKEETSWTRTNPRYDEAVRSFVQSMLADDVFVNDFAGFAATIGTYGAVNGLAQTLLKVTVPGVPDTFQGCELWNQSLVDPDNRKPVDFVARRRLLSRLQQESAEELGQLAKSLLEHWTDGTIKMHVLTRALAVRRAWPDLFLRGDYDAIGEHEHVVAFTRVLGAARLVVVVPRLTYRLTRGRAHWPLGVVWGNAELAIPAGEYRNVLNGQLVASDGRVGLSRLFESFPLALLLSGRM